MYSVFCGVSPVGAYSINFVLEISSRIAESGLQISVVKDGRVDWRQVVCEDMSVPICEIRLCAAAIASSCEE